MLLLGGLDWGSREYQTGIWRLQNDEWGRIGELKEVWKNNSIKIKFVYFSPSMMDLLFTSAHQFTTLETLARIRFTELTWMTKKKFRKFRLSDSNQDQTIIPSCFKSNLDTAFKYFEVLFCFWFFWFIFFENKTEFVKWNYMYLLLQRVKMIDWELQ